MDFVDKLPNTPNLSLLRLVEAKNTKKRGWTNYAKTELVHWTNVVTKKRTKKGKK